MRATSLEQTRSHCDAMIRRKQEEVYDLLKTIKGMVDRDERRCDGVDFSLTPHLVHGLNYSGVAQLAVKLQSATLELEKYVALKVQLEDLASAEAA